MLTLNYHIMKIIRKYVYILLILLFVCYQGYGQNLNFSVRLKINTQTDRNYRLSERVEIEALTSRHDVIFTQTYPGVIDPKLQLYYSLTIKGGRSMEEVVRSERSIESDELRANLTRRESIVRDFLATGIFEYDIYVYDVAHTNLCTNPTSVNDPDFLNEHGWPLRMINAPCAWAITRGNPNILIGVADTEFRTTHEDLQNRFASISGQSSGGNHHGTSVASVAAAGTNNGRGIAGVGYNSRIAAHRIVHSVVGGRAFADSRDIEIAIWNLYQMGVPIINVSWTITGLSVARARQITQNGTTLVLSGGNSVNAQEHTNIADIPGVIVVSSVDQNNMIGPTNHARNQWIDIVAPGRGIRVAGGNSDTHYHENNGTSFAAPFVAGTIALMLSVNPSLTPAQIEEILKATADPIADGHLLPGRGRLNAYAAVLASIQIYGSYTICGSTTSADFVVRGLPSTSIPTVRWEHSNNVTLMSAASVAIATRNSVCPPGSSCPAWIRAIVEIPGHQPFERTKNFFVGTVPNITRISTSRNNNVMFHGSCDNEDFITYNGARLTNGNAFGILEGNWRSTLEGGWASISPMTHPPLNFVSGSVANVGIPNFPSSNQTQIQVRLRNYCGWSDWRTITYREGLPCPQSNPLCPICWGLDPNCFCRMQLPCFIDCIEVRFFPNPTDDELFIVFEHLSIREQQILRGQEIQVLRNQTLTFSVRLFDSLGNIHRQIEFTHTHHLDHNQRNSRAEPIRFDVSTLREGTYYLHIEGNGQTEKHQIIINRN